jgi:hypothetical protein
VHYETLEEYALCHLYIRLSDKPGRRLIGRYRVEVQEALKQTPVKAKKVGFAQRLRNRDCPAHQPKRW